MQEISNINDERLQRKLHILNCWKKKLQRQREKKLVQSFEYVINKVQNGNAMRIMSKMNEEEIYHALCVSNYLDINNEKSFSRLFKILY